jgi:hypothetical protein
VTNTVALPVYGILSSQPKRPHLTPLPPPMSPNVPSESRPSPRSLLGRLIDGYNPGITLLVLLWVIGLTARRYLLERDRLVGFAEQALTSLVFVVPLMLVGWAVLAIADRYFALGIFPRDNE